MKCIGMAVAAGVGIMLAVSPSLAQPNKSFATRKMNPRKAERAKVFTGLRTVGPGRTLRLNVVEVGNKRSPNTVRLRIVDQNGKTLRRARQVLSTNRPVVLQYKIGNRGRVTSSKLMRAEFDIECPSVSASYLVATAEVVNVRTGVVESVSSCGGPCISPADPSPADGPPARDPPGGAAFACIGGDMLSVRSFRN